MFKNFRTVLGPGAGEECLSDTWLRLWNAIPPQRPGRLAALAAVITLMAASFTAGALTPDQPAQSDWGDFSNFTEVRYLLATEERTYLLCHASDVQFTEETRALYERLAGGVRDIRVVVEDLLS